MYSIVKAACLLMMLLITNLFQPKTKTCKISEILHLQQCSDLSMLYHWGKNAVIYY